VDTAELGRCHAPIKSRRPVLYVRRAAHRLQATTIRSGTSYLSQTHRTVPTMVTLSLLSLANICAVWCRRDQTVQLSGQDS
jgi:hypothetical protein